MFIPESKIQDETPTLGSLSSYTIIRAEYKLNLKFANN